MWFGGIVFGRGGLLLFSSLLRQEFLQGLVVGEESWAFVLLFRRRWCCCSLVVGGGGWHECSSSSCQETDGQPRRWWSQAGHL